MDLVRVSLDMPFYLRLADPLTVPYEIVCREAPLQALVGQVVRIEFSRHAVSQSDRADRPEIPRTRVSVVVESADELPDDSVATFAILNCREILNRVIAAYQVATGEVSNAGFIVPFGTSDMQIYADIRVNGHDARDRWPAHSFNTFPLSAPHVAVLTSYLRGEDELPLSRLFLTNAISALERGQYSLAVLQAATAVELRTTQAITSKLRDSGWSDEAIKPYERLALGSKLGFPRTDPRSLETHFDMREGFASAFERGQEELTQLRNDVAHRGHLATRDEAKDAVDTARDLLKVVD